MYADREPEAGKVSVKDRLKVVDSGRRRQSYGKRQRQDGDKWVHDLYDNKGPQVLSMFMSRKDRRDLRLKLQNKMTQSRSENEGISDLREKLSGSNNSVQLNTAAAKRRKVVVDSKLARKVIVQVPVPEAKKVTSTTSKKKTMQKAETVDSFLQSLGLEKYSITFQVEEIDMAAFLHMNDSDLKALGIPMGPRKKILLELDSKV